MTGILDRSAPRPDELDGMGSLLKQPQTIIWLKTATQSFAIHKSLLVESSKYFQRCLDGPFAESVSNTIDLDDVPPLTLGTYVKLCYFTRLTAARVKRRAADAEGTVYEVSPFSIKPCDMHTPHDLPELVDMWALTDRLFDDLLRGKVETAIRETLDVAAAKLADPRCAEWWVVNLANGYVALEALPRRGGGGGGEDDAVEGLVERMRDLFVANCAPATWKRLAAQLPGEFVVMMSIAFQARLAALVANEAAIVRVNQASLCYECKTRVQMALKR